MLNVVPAILLGLTMLCALGAPAAAQVTVTPTDTLFRAAYCSSAIAAVRRKRHNHADFNIFCGQWQSEGFKSIQQCTERKWQDADNNLAAKEKRFHDYVMLFLLSSSSNDLFTQLMAIAMRAQSDVQANLNNNGGGVECVRSCAGSADHATCFYQCIAPTNPTYASIWRCLTMPDELPF
jgi:hypothetical protein